MPVTIAIPFYNAEKYLLNTIKSVLAQTYTDWELILMDDGSTDRSLEIAQSVRDDRIRVFSDGANLKLSTRLNQVVDLARYDIIARMDADDMMSPSRIQKQVDYLGAHEEVDLVCTGAASVDENNHITGCRADAGDPISLRALLKKNTIVHPSVTARKAWWERNRYDASFGLAQDLELWLRALSESDFRIYYYSEPLYFYRENESLTLKKTFRYIKYQARLIRRYGQHNKWLQLLRLYIKAILKSSIILLGLDEMILKKRLMPISSAVKDRLESEIDMIVNTPVRLK